MCFLSNGLCSVVCIYHDCTIYSQHKIFALFFYHGPEECSAVQCSWCSWSKCSNNIIYSMQFSLVTLKTPWMQCMHKKDLFNSVQKIAHSHGPQLCIQSKQDTEMLSLQDVIYSTYSTSRTWYMKSLSCAVISLSFLQFEETRCVRKVFGISFIHFLLSSLWVNNFQSLQRSECHTGCCSRNLFLHCCTATPNLLLFLQILLKSL